jgi:putative FmdB family regulatory protein
MPTYDYECTKCGHEFEFFQKMTENPLTKCPKCEGKVKRLIGCGSGIIFKGSGFYATDYKKSSNKSSETASKSVPEGLPKEDRTCLKLKEGCDGCKSNK